MKVFSFSVYQNRQSKFNGSFTEIKYLKDLKTKEKILCYVLLKTLHTYHLDNK